VERGADGVVRHANSFDAIGHSLTRVRVRSWLVVVVVGYVESFVLLTMVLRAGMPVGVAYGVWTACSVALTWVMAMGIALIVAGVLTIETAGGVH
jgi:small multidrug resistance pump